MARSRRTLTLYLTASLLAMVVTADLVWSPASPLELERQKGTRRVPVLMIVFDKFPLSSLLAPDGSIDRRTFPNFHRLGQRSVWFRNATTREAFTKEALPSLLTGMRAENLGDLSDMHPQNFFTLLGDAYPVRTPEFLGRFCPLGSCPNTEGRRE